MPREKRVYSTSDMVAHVWAQQKQQSGRNGSGNIYFEGDTIYSYGSHFPMARFVQNKRGERAVLMTTRSYSSTTAGHLWDVRRAIPNEIPTFAVENVRDAVRSKEIRAAYEAKIKAALEQAVRSRIYKEQHLGTAQHLTRSANALSKFFALRWRLKVPELSQAEIDKARASMKAHRERIEREQAAAVKRRAEAEAQRAEDERLRREAWLRGENVRYPNTYGREGTLLRVHGDKVETSLGAEVPVTHAKRLWPHILKCRAEGVEYVKNGHTIHVGEFSIDRIDPAGNVKAGCHNIGFDQIQKVAVELGLLQAAA